MASLAWGGGSNYEKSSLSATVSDLGVINITEGYTCKNDAALTSVLALTVNACSLAGVSKDYMIIKNKSFTRKESGLWEASLNFETIVAESVIDNPDHYKFGCTTKANAEPIQTHPNFLSFAWPPGTNGAYYNPQTGDFEEFRIIHEQKPNTKAGVTDYLMPIVTYTLRKIIHESSVEAELKKLNKIEAPTSSRVLPRYNKRDWLRTSVDLNRVAKGLYECNITWSLSGPYGWNKHIYKSLS